MNTGEEMILISSPWSPLFIVLTKLSRPRTDSNNILQALHFRFLLTVTC